MTTNNTVTQIYSLYVLKKRGHFLCRLAPPWAPEVNPFSVAVRGAELPGVAAGLGLLARLQVLRQGPQGGRLRQAGLLP